MTRLTEFQAFILGQMRARRHCDEALASLGVTRHDVTEICRTLNARFPAGHTVKAYRAQLGSPSSEGVSGEGGYRAVVWRYSLPVWPEFDFAVHSDFRGVVGELSFVRKGEARVIAGVPPHQWRPWSFTESELLRLSPRFDVVEDWPPMRDYRGAIDGTSCIVRLDFGLVQEVIPPVRNRS
jgi:hypothetical protein